MKLFLIFTAALLAGSCKTTNSTSNVAAAEQYAPNWHGTFSQKLGQSYNFRFLEDLRVYIDEEDGKHYIRAKFRPLNGKNEVSTVTYRVYLTSGEMGKSKRTGLKISPEEKIDGLPEKLQVSMGSADQKNGTWTVQVQNKDDSKKLDSYEGTYKETSSSPVGD